MSFRPLAISRVQVIALAAELARRSTEKPPDLALQELAEDVLAAKPSKASQANYIRDTVRLLGRNEALIWMKNALSAYSSPRLPSSNAARADATVADSAGVLLALAFPAEVRDPRDGWYEFNARLDDAFFDWLDGFKGGSLGPGDFEPPPDTRPV